MLVWTFSQASKCGQFSHIYHLVFLVISWLEQTEIVTSGCLSFRTSQVVARSGPVGKRGLNCREGRAPLGQFPVVVS